MAIVNYLQFKLYTKPNPLDSRKSDVHVDTGVNALLMGGLVIDLLVGVDPVSLHSLGEIEKKAVPPPQVIRALVDTGCTITSIDTKVANSLKLLPRGYSMSYTANGPVSTVEHFVSIAFPGTQLTPRLVHRVQTVNLENQPIQALIGRDLMTAWNIVYNGTTGIVSISD